jgi:hypothetical protein
VRVHRAREHALEFEGLDLGLEPRRVAPDLADRLALALALGEFEELERALDAVPDAVEPRGDVLELRALAAERLGALRVVPDLRILEFAAYFGEPLALALVFKDTPLRRRGDPRGPSAGGGRGRRAA